MTKKISTIFVGLLLIAGCKDTFENNIDSVVPRFGEFSCVLSWPTWGGDPNSTHANFFDDGTGKVNSTNCKSYSEVKKNADAAVQSLVQTKSGYHYDVKNINIFNFTVKRNKDSYSCHGYAIEYTCNAAQINTIISAPLSSENIPEYISQTTKSLTQKGFTILKSETVKLETSSVCGSQTGTCTSVNNTSPAYFIATVYYYLPNSSNPQQARIANSLRSLNSNGIGARLSLQDTVSAAKKLVPRDSTLGKDLDHALDLLGRIRSISRH